MAKKEPTGWITVNGHHVPIYEGESKQDAYNRTIAKMNEDKKASDIAKRKEEADKLNGKSESKSENKSQIRHVEEYARKDNGTELLQVTKDKIDKMGLGALPSEIMKDKAYLKRLEKYEASLGSNITDIQRKEIERSRRINQNTIAYMEKRLAELESGKSTREKNAEALGLDYNKLNADLINEYESNQAEYSKSSGNKKAELAKWLARNKKSYEEAKSKSKVDTKLNAQSKNKSKVSALEFMKEQARQFNEAKIEARKQGALEMQFTDADGKVHKMWWDGGRYTDKKPNSTAMSEKYSKMKGVYKIDFKMPKDWK